MQTTTDEIVFLFFASETSDYDDDIIYSNDEIEEFSFDFLIPMVGQVNGTFPIAAAYEEFKDTSFYIHCGHQSRSSYETDYLAWHYMGELSKNKLFELYLKREDKLFQVVVSSGSASKIDKLKNFKSDSIFQIKSKRNPSS